jgi:carotenoid cleavage dioxygenase
VSEPFPTDDPYLCNGFEPIRFECDYADLAIDGRVPMELSGSLYRIGPNPQFKPRGGYNPLLGDGMIHAFHFRNGRVSYRNRWVRTEQWSLERAAGRSLFATSGNPREHDPEVAALRTNGVANTNVVWHAGKLLALEEGHAPIRLDPLSLDTLGVWTFEGRLPANMTAHPKVDPETGEMLFFANFPNRDFSGKIAYYVASAGGELIKAELFSAPFPALVHDFVATKDFVLFFVCPIVLSIARARAGGIPFAWEPDRGTHVGVFPRGGGTDDIRWFSGDACMVWHAVNAFNDGETICIDVCQQQAAAFPTAAGTMPEPSSLRQFLTRWTVDWSGAKRFTVARLSDVVCEYPRLDERRAGVAYRHAFFACGGGPGTGDLFHRGIGHFDHRREAMRVYHPGEHCALGEPVFVPRATHSAEGEGYVLTTIYDERRNASHLAILDAQHVEDGPIACAHLDHRVPLGFHGTWRPSSNP